MIETRVIASLKPKNPNPEIFSALGFFVV